MEVFELFQLPAATLIVLFGAIVIALAFEAVNGFHDTANAVATVIYTNSLRARTAVVVSGTCNFLGVYLGGMGVAFAIVHLLPTNLLINAGSKAGMAMIFAILISAISWNICTWYRGIPCSSSHALIGAIVGVGLANALVEGGRPFQAASFGSVEAVILSLLISPLLGFGLAALVLWSIRKVIRDGRLHESPHDRKPPAWVRAVLVMTSTGVSLAHGSNDGQKGVGLIMIILIGCLPAHFALNLECGANRWHETIHSLQKMAGLTNGANGQMLVQASFRESEANDRVASSSGMLELVSPQLEDIIRCLDEHKSPTSMSPEKRSQLRKDILLLEDRIRSIERAEVLEVTDAERAIINKARADLRRLTDYAPTWVILVVATAIGLGTMVGWKRVVVTVGEKIGKEPLTYAQGASSEIVAMLTIGFADVLGLPVSTTHVLSSGVTGTMVANRVGLKYRTVRDIALAWVLTFPATMLLGGLLFLLFCFPVQG
jgi:phosphate/sulfate permease